MLSPLGDLVDKACDMTPDQFRAAVLKLQLPADGFAGALRGLLVKAVDAGRVETLDRASASAGGAA
jgi:hypothetical protein